MPKSKSFYQWVRKIGIWYFLSEVDFRSILIVKFAEDWKINA